MIHERGDEKIEINPENPDPDLVSLVTNGSMTVAQYMQEVNGPWCWDKFRDFLKTSGVFFKCFSPAVPAFLAVEIRRCLDRMLYSDLVLYVNGIPEMFDGLKQAVEFSAAEQNAVNQAAENCYLPGPIFTEVPEE